MNRLQLSAGQGHQVALSDTVPLRWKPVFDEHGFPGKSRPRALVAHQPTRTCLLHSQQTAETWGSESSASCWLRMRDIASFLLWWFGMPSPIPEGWWIGFFCFTGARPTVIGSKAIVTRYGRGPPAEAKTSAPVRDRRWAAEDSEFGASTVREKGETLAICFPSPRQLPPLLCRNGLFCPRMRSMAAGRVTARVFGKRKSQLGDSDSTGLFCRAPHPPSAAKTTGYPDGTRSRQITWRRSQRPRVLNSRTLLSQASIPRAETSRAVLRL